MNTSLPPSGPMPVGPLIGIALGLVVLGLLLWGIKNPLAWILVSVLFITAGVGCLVYGITEFIGLDAHRDAIEHLSRNAVSEVATFIGAGAGSIVGGGVLLFVSLQRWKKAG